MEPDGSLWRCVNVLVTRGGERSPAEAFAPVQDDTKVWIVPSIAGD